jgi:hypothetical protein
VWHAALAIANQDAEFGGDSCIRCHSPNAWLEGRSVPTDASAFTFEDFDGVHCNFCHRLVDPVARTMNPAEDTPILNSLAKAGLLPTMPGNGRYVVDDQRARRGRPKKLERAVRLGSTPSSARLVKDIGTEHHYTASFYMNWFFRCFASGENGWALARTPDGRSISEQDAYLIQALEIIARTLNLMMVEERNRIAARGRR